MREKEHEPVRVVVACEPSGAAPLGAAPIVLDGALDDVIASFAAARERIPKAFRASAFCSIGADEEYGNSFPTVEIHYDRAPTASEVALLRAEAEALQVQIDAQRRASYEELRRFFDGASASAAPSSSGATPDLAGAYAALIEAAARAGVGISRISLKTAEGAARLIDALKVRSDPAKLQGVSLSWPSESS